MTELDKNNDKHFFDDEIDIISLFKVLWEGKKTIILITSIIAVLSVIYSLSLSNYYRSESILVGAEPSNNSSLSQYSGLASLAGVRKSLEILPDSRQNK